jgi:hypothetical protein
VTLLCSCFSSQRNDSYLRGNRSLLACFPYGFPEAVLVKRQDEKCLSLNSGRIFVPCARVERVADPFSELYIRFACAQSVTQSSHTKATQKQVLRHSSARDGLICNRYRIFVYVYMYIVLCSSSTRAHPRASSGRSGRRASPRAPAVESAPAPDASAVGCSGTPPRRPFRSRG